MRRCHSHAGLGCLRPQRVGHTATSNGQSFPPGEPYALISLCWISLEEGLAGQARSSNFGGLAAFGPRMTDWADTGSDPSWRHPYSVQPGGCPIVQPHMTLPSCQPRTCELHAAWCFPRTSGPAVLRFFISPEGLVANTRTKTRHVN